MFLLTTKLSKADGEISVQLADLLVFVGYFGLCLYIGGIAYISAYNNFFGIVILNSSGIIETSLIFVEAANLGLFSFVLLAIFIIILAFLFFLSRFVLRLYFGYSLIIAIFCMSTLVASFIGTYFGSKAAANSVNVDTSNLPNFKMSGHSGRYDDGSFRLLHDNGSQLYVTTLVAEGSLVQIDILTKNKIPKYEVTLK